MAVEFYRNRRLRSLGIIGTSCLIIISLGLLGLLFGLDFKTIFTGALGGAMGVFYSIILRQTIFKSH